MSTNPKPRLVCPLVLYPLAWTVGPLHMILQFASMCLDKGRCPGQSHLTARLSPSAQLCSWTSMCRLKAYHCLPISRTVHFTNRHYTDNALDYKTVKYWWTILWQLQKKIFFHLFSVSWSWIKPFWKNVSDWREEKERKLSKQIIKIINPSNRTQKNILVVQHIKWYCFFWQLFWWLSERNYVFSKIMSSLQNNG